MIEIVAAALFFGALDAPAQANPKCVPVISAAQQEQMRGYFARPDRTKTRDTEARIAKMAQDCTRGRPQAEVKPAEAALRAFFVGLGYRKSSAARAPDYFYCRLHYDYSPPQYTDYYDIYYYSAVIRDPAPDRFIDKKQSVTERETQVDARLRQWIAGQNRAWGSERVGTPTYVDDIQCSHFATAAEATNGLKDNMDDIGNEALATGVQ